MFNASQLESALLELGVPQPAQIFEDLQAAYTEPGRFYHSSEHVADCLRLLKRHRELANRPAEVEIAIWFHDAVYDSRRSDNEQASAAWAERYLCSQGVAGSAVERVAEMILATKSHAGPLESDSQLLVDIDLAILGQPLERFEAYDRAIRQEYAWVSDADYREGRYAVLDRFLGRTAIYGTETFRNLYESQARENIARKLVELRG